VFFFWYFPHPIMLLAIALGAFLRLLLLAMKPRCVRRSTATRREIARRWMQLLSTSVL